MHIAIPGYFTLLIEWWGAGVVICLERGADLHTAQLQLMPLTLTVSCFCKIQIGFTFLVPAHQGSPGKGADKRVCACVCVYTVNSLAPPTCHGIPPKTSSRPESAQSPVSAGSNVPSHDICKSVSFVLATTRSVAVSSLLTPGVVVVTILLLVFDDDTPGNCWTPVKMLRPAIALWLAANGTAIHCRHTQVSK